MWVEGVTLFLGVLASGLPNVYNTRMSGDAGAAEARGEAPFIRSIPLLYSWFLTNLSTAHGPLATRFDHRLHDELKL
jgi:hypothetical protein